VCGGKFQIEPAPIEDHIGNLSTVQAAAVVGVFTPEQGEIAIAFVVCNPAACVTEEDILDHCKNGLEYQYVPSGVQFMDSLPRTATGKVHRDTLKQLYTPKCKTQ